VQQGGVQLTDEEQADLIAFLRSLDDPQFIANSRFSNNN
jgi:cytochrome c1